MKEIPSAAEWGGVSIHTHPHPYIHRFCFTYANILSYMYTVVCARVQACGLVKCFLPEDAPYSPDIAMLLWQFNSIISLTS